MIRLPGPVDYEEWRSLLVKAGVRLARLHDAHHSAAMLLLVLHVPTRAVLDVIVRSQAEHGHPVSARAHGRPDRHR